MIQQRRHWRFHRKLELANVVKAWHLGKVQSGTEQKIDAVARAHGKPVTDLVAEWATLMVGFKKRWREEEAADT